MLVLRKKLLKPRGWPTLLGSAVRGLIRGWRLLGEVRPDAVYVSTIIIPQWPLLARLRRTNAISHVHEAEAAGSRLLTTALYLPHLVSTRCIVNSEFTQKAIGGALAPLARRSEIVYNGVISTDSPTPPRKHLEGALRLLYLGRLSPRKGPDLVIDAAARLRERGRPAAVTLLGTVFEGYEWYEEQLRDQAVTSGIDVDFAGFHHDIWPFLAASDMLIVPSRVDESFGNTVVEGVLAQRPVIVSDSGGLREAAGGYRTARLAAPDDATDIAWEVVSIADDWDDVVGAVGTAREEALRRHAPEQYRAGIAEVVLGRRSAMTLRSP
ncbi:MAG: glycosyltransferase family 4 protein [Brachybacterium tyrofermentans]|uniref:glycosyltransferase family 4 protein n=1 Tax=Brachybacterium tyrofermentans TaxID=47848 RepID=UPI003FB6D427